MASTHSVSVALLGTTRSYTFMKNSGLTMVSRFTTTLANSTCL